MFKLFLCNPFARSAGIFLLSLLSLLSLLRLQFTPFAISCLRAFTRFYALDDGDRPQHAQTVLSQPIMAGFMETVLSEHRQQHGIFS